MKIIKNKTILFYILILNIFVLLIIFSNILLYQNHIKKVNGNVLAIINTIRTNYPSISDEEFASILNNEKIIANDDILKDYGVSKNDILMMENTSGFL
jgi:uncharacterized ubiquitin-like protein YukD